MSVRSVERAEREAGAVPWSPLPSRRGDDGPAPAQVSGLLDAVMAGLGAPTVDVVVVVHQRWDEVVGQEVAPHARPVGVADGRLTVVVDSPGWASHLRWSESEILARLATLIGPDQVTSVQLRVGRR